MSHLNISFTLSAKTSVEQKNKTIKQLKYSLRYFLVNNIGSRGTTKAERALHLKKIYLVLSGEELVNQTDARELVVTNGGGYTCNISSNIDYAFSLPAEHLWYKDLVAVVFNSIAQQNSEYDSFLNRCNCFENCCAYTGYKNANEFRLWLLEYCYKTLTKKGRI